MQCVDLLVTINEQTGRTNAEHDINTLGIFCWMQIHAIHRQFLSIFQIVKLGFGWRLATMRLMQVDHFVFQFGRLIRCEFEFFHIAAIFVFIWIVVAQFRLH